MTTDPPTARVGGVRFTVQSLDDAIDTVVRRADAGRATPVHFANAYTIALARHDERYRALLNRPGSLVYSDGTPVTWVGRRGYPDLADRWQRVYGPDVLAGVLDRSGPADIRHFFLGGTPETLQALVDTVAQRWPRARVVGSFSPPFRPATPADHAEQVRLIGDSGASVVWVGLGTPKQDLAVARLARDTATVALGVGAAFDFLAGSKPQAPVWMQRSGTEWLFRLGSEPGRLWQRYLWGNPQFLLAAAREPGLRRRS